MNSLILALLLGSPQTISDKDMIVMASLSNKQAHILNRILKLNAETVEYRATLGQIIYPIPLSRAQELAREFAIFEDHNPRFFWAVWFPSMGYGAGFWNGINDKNLSSRRWSWGYCEMRESVIVWTAERTGHVIPEKGIGRWIVLHWWAALDLGYFRMKWLYDYYGEDELLTLNAYQCGIQGTEDGVWGLKYRQLSVREECLKIYRMLYDKRGPR